MDLKEYMRKELVSIIKHARHELPWLYVGISHSTNKQYSVSYQSHPERFVGTHIRFDGEDAGNDRYEMNDDGQMLQEYLGRLLCGEIKRFESNIESDPRAKGSHYHKYFFKELLKDGSLVDAISYIDFYSISPMEVEAIMEAEKICKDVPEEGEPKTQREAPRI